MWKGQVAADTWLEAEATGSEELGMAGADGPGHCCEQFQVGEARTCLGGGRSESQTQEAHGV